MSLSFALVFFISATVAVFILWRLYKNNLAFLRFKVTLDSFFDSLLIYGISFAIGARLLYIAQHWSFFTQDPFRFFLFLHFPGFSFFGGVVGAAAGLWLFSRVRKQPFLLLLDLLHIGVLFVFSFSRIGSFLAKDTFGRETHILLYEAILAFGTFLLLHSLYKRGRMPKGEISLYFLLLIGLSRFFVEIRANDSVYLGSIFFILISVGILVYQKQDSMLKFVRKK